MTSKKVIVVIYGGVSAEHEVSCRSAAYVLKNLDKTKYDILPIGIRKDGSWHKQSLSDLLNYRSPELPIEKDMSSSKEFSSSSPKEWFINFCGPHIEGRFDDCVLFPVIHGTNGEDGTLQGFLELIGINYVGSNHLGSAIGMDKVVAKKLVQHAGIDVVPWVDFDVFKWKTDKSVLLSECQKLKYPLFVKPVNSGSSVGITMVSDESGLESAIEFALKYDMKVLIETGISAREIECAVISGEELLVSIPGEIEASKDFYSYDAKYNDADGAKIQVPANLTAVQTQNVREIASVIYGCLELYGMARVDLFIDKNSQKIYFNEVNTIPGFTQISQFPVMWEKSNVSAKELIDKLIESAVLRGTKQKELVRTW